MIHLMQHIPTFLDGAQPKQAAVSTAEDLDRIEWIAAYKRDAMPPFYRWSCSPLREDGRGVLIAEYAGGAKWCVVAYCDQPIPGLPTWKAPQPAE